MEDIRMKKNNTTNEINTIFDELVNIDVNDRRRFFEPFRKNKSNFELLMIRLLDKANEEVKIIKSELQNYKDESQTKQAFKLLSEIRTIENLIDYIDIYTPQPIGLPKTKIKLELFCFKFESYNNEFPEMFKDELNKRLLNESDKQKALINFRNLYLRFSKKPETKIYNCRENLRSWIEKQGEQSNDIKHRVFAWHYAILHHIYIIKDQHEPFKIDWNDRLPKTLIENCAKKNYPETNANGFYKAFKEISISSIDRFINSKTAKDKTTYKDIIIKLSDNNKKVIDYLS